MTADQLTKVKIYEAIQRGISETDGISFKLISLVPLVSGTALLTIVLGETKKPILILLSLFAAAITLGIFWWELWNMRTCHWFINLAEKLEKEAIPKLSFDRPGGIITKDIAAKIIYGATIFTWLTLAMLIGGWPTPSFVSTAAYALGVIIAVLTIYALSVSTEPSAAPNSELCNQDMDLAR